MSEHPTIVSINDDGFSRKDERYKYNRHFSGVQIALSDGSSVMFGIQSGHNCCETWDYLHSADNFDDYIGAEFLGLVEKDTWPENIKDEWVDKQLNSEWNELGFQAIDVLTSKGVLQFAVYNSHNGYYSHATILVDRDRVEESSL